MSEDPTEALLQVARDIIAKRGYVGLTMRTAAAAAGVTPDVARRYYRNREMLLAAALRLPDDPVSAIPTLLAPGIEGMGERLVRFTLDTLRDPQARDDLMSMARAGVNAGQAVTGLQEFIEVGVVDRVAGSIGVPDARMRASLITSYLMGVAIMRYGVRLEPLASASEEEVIRMVAPVIQDLLDPRRPIPGSARDRARAEGNVDRADQPGIRQRTFDPDPAATRAAKQRTEAEAAARASTEAKRAAAKSDAKFAAGSMARPATRSAAMQPSESTPESATGAATKSGAAPKPESSSDAKAVARSVAKSFAEGRGQRRREAPPEATPPRKGPAGAEADEAAATPAAKPGANQDVAAKPASRIAAQPKPAKKSTARPRPAKKATTRARPAKKAAAPGQPAPSSPAPDTGAGTSQPPGGTTGRAASEAAPEAAPDQSRMSPVDPAVAGD